MSCSLLSIFKFRNECYKQVEQKKMMEKRGHLCSFYVPSLSYDPYIVEKSAFLQFYAAHAKKSNYIKAIYINASESSPYALSENGIVYSAMT